MTIASTPPRRRPCSSNIGLQPHGAEPADDDAPTETMVVPPERGARRPDTARPSPLRLSGYPPSQSGPVTSSGAIGGATRSLQ
jgi:hypothetical protein